MTDLGSGFGIVLLVVLALFALWVRGRRARDQPKPDSFGPNLGPGSRSRGFGPNDPPRHHPGNGRW
jgi:hypothetical protein